MTRVAIITALAGELKPLVRGWDRDRRHGVDLWRRGSGESEWTAACAGVGAEAVARAFAEVEREGKLDRVISAGWAGALSEQYVAGRAYRVDGVIDAQSGDRYPVEAAPPPLGRPGGKPSGEGAASTWLITTPRVADAAEKRRLAAAHGAGLVDMEAAEIARLAAARGIPFGCVKGVSDGFSDRLPDFNRFIGKDGRFESIRFMFFALVRPGGWPALVRLGKNSGSAARDMRTLLIAMLQKAESRL